MKILESDLGRVQLRIRRTWGRQALSLLAAACLIVGAGLFGVDAMISRTPPVPDALPEPTRLSCQRGFDLDACFALDPSLGGPVPLFEVYLGLRDHYRHKLLPVAFPTEAYLSDALFPRAHRDATETSVGWNAPDPIVGQRLGEGPAPSDAAIRAQLHAYKPPLSYTSADPSLEGLLDRGVVREVDGGYTLQPSPEAGEIARRAALDLQRYERELSSDLQRLANKDFEAKVQQREQHERKRQRRIALRAHVAEVWRGRLSGLMIALAAALGAAVVWLTGRRLPVTIDAHAVRFPRTRLLWEELADLTWREDRVEWRTTDGRTGQLRGLQLSLPDTQTLERTCWTLCALEHGDRDAEAEEALAALVAHRS